MNDNEFKAACLELEAHQKLIAALKLQRWDVVKWAVAINVGLATASTAIRTPPAPWLLFGFAVIVAGIGGWLIWHYSCRLDKARTDAANIEEYLIAHGINLKEMTKRPAKPISHDKEEFFGFSAALAVSLFPTFFASLFL